MKKNPNKKKGHGTCKFAVIHFKQISLQKHGCSIFRNGDLHFGEIQTFVIHTIVGLYTNFTCTNLG